VPFSKRELPEERQQGVALWLCKLLEVDPKHIRDEGELVIRNASAPQFDLCYDRPFDIPSSELESPC